MLRSSLSLFLFVFCLVFSCGYCLGQAKVGLAFGANVSRTILMKDYKDYVQGYWEVDDGYNKAGWHAGFYLDMPLARNISAETGLILVKRGHKVIDEGFGQNARLHERSTYLELPLLFKYNLHHWIFQTGISPSYWVGRHFQLETNGNSNEPHYYGFTQGGVDFSRLNYTLNLGVGYKLPWLEGASVMFQFHQLTFEEKKAAFSPLFPLHKSSYFSLTTRVDLAEATSIKMDSLGIYWKVRAGTEFQSGYGSGLGTGYYPGAHPLSFKGGLLAGKILGKWRAETGVLYAQRKKLFGNVYRIRPYGSPIAAVMDNGVELRKDLLEIPLNLKYFLTPSFYLHGGLSSQFELATQTEAYMYGKMSVDRWDQFRRKQLLIALNAGAGYKLPALFGHSIYVEAHIQQGLNTIEANYFDDLGFKPRIAGLSLDVEF